MVSEVKEGSNAAQSSTKIQLGDQLLAVSGREMVRALARWEVHGPFARPACTLVCVACVCIRSA